MCNVNTVCFDCSCASCPTVKQIFSLIRQSLLQVAPSPRTRPGQGCLVCVCVWELIDPYGKVLLSNVSNWKGNYRMVQKKKKHKLFNFFQQCSLFFLLIDAPRQKKHVITQLLLCVTVYWPILFSQTLNAPLAALIVEDVIIYVSSLFPGSCMNAEAHKRNRAYLNKWGWNVPFEKRRVKRQDFVFPRVGAFYVNTSRRRVRPRRLHGT